MIRPQFSFVHGRSQGAAFQDGSCQHHLKSVLDSLAIANTIILLPQCIKSPLCQVVVQLTEYFVQSWVKCGDLIYSHCSGLTIHLKLLRLDLYKQLKALSEVDLRELHSPSHIELGISV